MDNEPDKLPKYNPDFVKELLDAAKKPPEKTFDNVEDMLRWLDVHYNDDQ